MRAPLLAAAALLASGCGGRAITKADMAKPDVSLVCGYIDMKEAPARVDYLTVRQVLPKTDKPYWSFGARKGVFCHFALPPGSYQLEQFGGMSGLRLGAVALGGRSYIYKFPGQADGFRLARSEVRFLGSFKYKQAGTFFKPKFEIEPAKSPTEREVLLQVQPRVVGTRWEPLVAKRLAELKR